MIFFLTLLFLNQAKANPEMMKMEVLIPQEIFALVKKDFSINGLEYSPEFLDMEVVVRSAKTEQKVLVGYSQEVLDLSSYVDKKWEDFKVVFNSPFPQNQDTVVYFLNRYKPTELGPEKLGLDCRTALKMSSKASEFFDSRGFTVQTRAGQFLNLLGGDYLILKKEGLKIKMVFFKIRDGRWSHRLCT